MNKNPSAIATAKNVEATKAEGELRKAAGDALKRAGLPEDLIERTKTLPGNPFTHATAFAKLPDADRANLSRSCVASSRDGPATTRRTSSRDCRPWISRPVSMTARGMPWEAPLAIGNVAGGEWAGPGCRAWRACERVMASTAGEETGAREMLLADLRAIFEAEDWAGRTGFPVHPRQAERDGRAALG